MSGEPTERKAVKLYLTGAGLVTKPSITSITSTPIQNDVTTPYAPAVPCNDPMEFPELTFVAPGDYKYVIKELTPSGNGWEVDTHEYVVIIHVTTDAAGNLVADAEYPQGFPVFVNIFTEGVVRVSIVARTYTVGATLQTGMFSFGMYDMNGVLVPNSETANGPYAAGCATKKFYRGSFALAPVPKEKHNKKVVAYVPKKKRTC